jgi:hypothetical protein
MLPRSMPSAWIASAVGKVRVFLLVREADEGMPLTQIAREVGTSVRMIEQHYAGVIADWDGNLVSADSQIRAAHRDRREIDALGKRAESAGEENPWKSSEALCRTRTDDPFLTMEVQGDDERS